MRFNIGKHFDNANDLYDYLESVNELYNLVDDGKYASFDDVSDYFDQHKDTYNWGVE